MTSLTPSFHHIRYKVLVLCWPLHIILSAVSHLMMLNLWGESLAGGEGSDHEDPHDVGLPADDGEQAAQGRQVLFSWKKDVSVNSKMTFDACSGICNLWQCKMACETHISAILSCKWYMQCKKYPLTGLHYNANITQNITIGRAWKFYFCQNDPGKCWHISFSA